MSLPHPSLTGVPPETLNKICKFLDYKQIMGLRPVCRRLKNYVDHFRPDFGLKFIGIRAMKDCCELFFRESSKEKIIKHIDGEEHQWKPFETLLAHQKSPLSKFSMYSITTGNQKGYSEMWEKTETCLSAHVPRLQVKDCDICAKNENDVMKILPYIDPGFLRFLSLGYYSHSIVFIPQNTTGNLERVKQLEHWKVVKDLDVKLYWIEDLKFEELEHLKKFKIHIKDLKMSDVNALKEKIFTSSIKTKNVAIGYRNLIKDAEISPGHLPANDPEVYRYPMTSRKLLLIQFSPRLSIRGVGGFLEISIFPRRGRR